MRLLLSGFSQEWAFEYCSNGSPASVCAVAGRMLWTVPSFSIVGVSEVEGCVALDGVAAACAWDGVLGEDGGPAGTLYLVRVSVPAFGGGASGAVGFPLVCGAVAFAGVDEGGASVLRAGAFRHVVTPFMLRALSGRTCAHYIPGMLSVCLPLSVRRPC